MDPVYDLHSWNKQRREGALGEARRRSAAERAKEERPTRFRPGPLGAVLSGLLGLLR